MIFQPYPSILSWSPTSWWLVSCHIGLVPRWWSPRMSQQTKGLLSVLGYLWLMILWLLWCTQHGERRKCVGKVRSPDSGSEVIQSMKWFDETHRSPDTWGGKDFSQEFTWIQFQKNESNLVCPCTNAYHRDRSKNESLSNDPALLPWIHV